MSFDQFRNRLEALPGWLFIFAICVVLVLPGLMLVPMSFTDAWETAYIPALDASVGFWFRIDVDGTIFYGATPLTTGC